MGSEMAGERLKFLAPQDGAEQRAAAGLLNVATRSMCDWLTKLNAWLLAAAGASFVMIITDHEKLTLLRVVEPSGFWLSGLLLVASLIVGSVAMVLLGQIGAGLSAAEKVASDPISPDLDLSVLFAHYLRGLIWPWRGIADRGIRAVQQGDLVALARRLSILGQLTTMIVVFQAALILLAFAVLVAGDRSELVPSEPRAVAPAVTGR